MRKVKLKIQVNKSQEETFYFVINPENTPKWVEGIVEEETNEWPVGLGSIYRNKNKEGAWSTYLVDEFEHSRLFTLTSEDGNYHVRYIVTSNGENVCTLEYIEWVDEGELTEPFMPKALQKLKDILEK